MLSTRGKHNYLSRRVAEAALDVALLKGTIAKWCHRVGLQGALGVSSHEIRLTKGHLLPRPLIVAFASDFHAGPSTHPEVFSELFDELSRIQPDVLLLGGDFVSCKSVYCGVIAASLARHHPPFGKYAVFGNHDLWADEPHLTGLLADAGVEVLVNRNRALPPPFDSVSICGIDDPWTGDVDARQAFADAAGIRIFLTHSPDGLLLLDGENFDVGFAGHTHGGQIALPDGTPIIVPNGPLCRAYAHGRFELDGNGPLIVSRGIGCSTIPIRFNADPELVICTVR